MEKVTIEFARDVPLPSQHELASASERSDDRCLDPLIGRHSSQLLPIGRSNSQHHPLLCL